VSNLLFGAARAVVISMEELNDVEQNRARRADRTDGRIEVRVRGLVLAAGPSAGTNPIAQFKAIVSCLTPMTDASSGTLVAATVNRSTNTFPATTTGDADIEDAVSLPSPCIAPIVFVTSPTGAWFSATGF
jgi:hypothetical protein